MSGASDIVIRAFQASDAERAAVLCEEMQAHYGAACPTRREIVADLLDLPPGVRLLLAEARAEILGLAFLSPLYPGPGLRKGLFLKDLYVAAAARGRGIGRSLMGACAAAAAEGGYLRIDWTAALGTERLLAFYRSLGAEQDPNRAFFRLSGDALSRLAAFETEL